jgi:hypothetical protein
MLQRGMRYHLEFTLRAPRGHALVVSLTDSADVIAGCLKVRETCAPKPGVTGYKYHTQVWLLYAEMLVLNAYGSRRDW